MSRFKTPPCRQENKPATATHKEPCLRQVLEIRENSRLNFSPCFSKRTAVPSPVNIGPKPIFKAYHPPPPGTLPKCKKARKHWLGTLCTPGTLQNTPSRENIFCPLPSDLWFLTSDFRPLPPIPGASVVKKTASKRPQKIASVTSVTTSDHISQRDRLLLGT